MKRFLILALCVGFIFSAAGCKSDKNTDDASEVTSAVSSEEETESEKNGKEPVTDEYGNEILSEAPLKKDADVCIKDADGKIWIEAADIELVKTVKDSSNGKFVSLQFVLKEESKDKFRAATAANIGKKLGLYADGKLIASPAVNAEINSRDFIMYIPEKEDAEKIYSSLTDK